MNKNGSTYGKILILLLISIVFKAGFAQKGIPYISNFSLPASMSANNYQVVQGDNDMIYVLNQNGVFSFDGYGWEYMPIGGQAFAITYLDKLFVGGERVLGYFKKNLKGINVYVPIEHNESELFYLFHSFNNILYVVGINGIYKIRRVEPYKVENYYTEKDSTQIITDLFNVGEQLFIIKNKLKIFRIYKQDANQINSSILGNNEILFSFKHNDIQIIGTSNNKLFKFDGKSFSPIYIKDQSYIDTHYLTGGISIDEKTIALSTLIGGCIIINTDTGATSQIINYSSGLPDDEVTALIKDKNKGLWLIHGMGISRVDLSIPISSFHHIPSLRGNILSTAKFNNTLFVGTSDGLYRLTELQNFTAKIIEYATHKPVVKIVKQSAQTQTSPEFKTAQPSSVKKKGLLARIFGGERTEKAGIDESVQALTNENEVEQIEYEKKVFKKNERVLLSSNFTFQKINEINGKINSLQTWNNNLFIASSTGLYNISFAEPKLIIPNEYIYCINPSITDKSLLYIGTWGSLYQLKYERGAINTRVLINLNNERVTSVSEISESVIVFTTDYKVYKVTNINSSNPLLVPISAGEQTIVSPIVRKVGNDIIIISPNRVYKYYQLGDSIGLNPEYNQQSNYKVFYSNSEQTWLRSGQVWSTYPNTEQNNRIAKYLGLFDRVNYVTLADSNEVWVVNGFNQLYKIYPNRQSDTLKAVNLFLKQVLDKLGNSLNTNYVELESKNNAFKVKLGAPFYLKEKGVDYQFKLVGLMSEWSDWGNTPEKDFPFFPPGNYVLQIRARDALGNVSQIKEFPFTVKPPFYQTVWFYSLVAAFIVALVIILIRVRERNLIREKQVLEQKVKERTKTIEEQKNAIEKQRDELKVLNQEILQQKEEIEAQRDEITSQRDQIISQNQDIIKSISYARRIQTAAMPSKEFTDSILKDYFILLKPRDIVSGDFYWVTKKSSKVIVTAADCTGHGVPGAFMSLLGITLLTEIVKNTDDLRPHTLLNELRNNIKRALSQVGRENEAKDGMD
ncbi:MAG: triple tyrosine motif-containing protein [Bacteroidota bacterium]